MIGSDTFFKELQRLILLQPKSPVSIKSSVECDYGDKISNSKKLFNCYDCDSCTDCSDTYDSYMCVNCNDCDYCVESELCYECNDAYKCYNGNFLDKCTSVRDAYYSYRCIGCNDIFGCANLTNKQFCVFNRQFSEQEYKELLGQLKKTSSTNVLKILEEIKMNYPATQTNEGHNENTSYGDYIYYNLNSYLCFDAARNENSAYIYDGFYNKNTLDVTYSSHNELSLEVVDSVRLFNCDHAVYAQDCQDSSYIFHCIDVKNCLGCVDLSHKQFCILNRQLNEQLYNSACRVIKESLYQSNMNWDSLVF